MIHTLPERGKDYTSQSGKVWEWCGFWRCWQRANYKRKIYESDGEFTASAHSTWINKIFSTFEEAEKEVLSS